jgi:hypothetical protein
MAINRFVSDESIEKEVEMKKVKVLDYHFYSDLSRNLPQFIQPMQSVSSRPCLVDGKEAKELTDVPD